MSAAKLLDQHAASFAVGRLSSLFAVCALALDASNEWADAPREEYRRKISDTLMMGAALADEATLLVEKLEVSQ